MLSAPDLAWPHEFIHRYQSEGYWKDGTFYEELVSLRDHFSERIAVVDGETVVSYAQLKENVDALAHGLYALGLRKGDKVVLQLSNCNAFIASCFAMARLGIVPVFALPAHRYTEIAAFCASTGAQAYIAPDIESGFDYRQLARQLQQSESPPKHIVILGEAEEFVSFDSLYTAHNVALPDTLPQSQDLFGLLLSGGSTSIPKLIPRLHCDYLYNIRTSISICQFTEHTVYLAALPVAHNFTMASPGFFGALFSGGTVVMARDPSPETCFELIARHHVTDTALVPPLVILWLEAATALHTGDLKTLRCLQVGGAKLVEEIARKVKPVLGCQLQQVFGMAEGLVCYTGLNDNDDLIASTQGCPMSPGDELRIVDENDQDVADGEVGTLLTRGPYTIRGYYNLPAHNATAFTRDGFYRTGDLVRRLPNGYLIVEGRDKDQINRGGEKISPEEIENMLLSHPDVFDAAIVAIPDKTWGERTCAFIVARNPSLKTRELGKHLRSQGLAAFKIPDRFELIEAFPNTGVGKTSRRALREALQIHYIQVREIS